ncbi:MAG: recombination protein RecR [Malacoplasma sp.]|nr:recombination protein RecR [Malacoplasma sp.]
MKPNQFEILVDAFMSLPGISKKSAERISYFILQKDQEFFTKFIDRIIESRLKIKFCATCNNLTDDSFRCEICLNQDRHDKSLCVVTTVEDLYKVEQSESFYGLYYVLQSEINYKKPETASLIDIDKFENMVNNFQINKIIFATNMTINGELTANYLKNYLKEKKYNIEFYRPAIGMPANASIDYMDWESLRYSIKNKTKLD